MRRGFARGFLLGSVGTGTTAAVGLLRSVLIAHVMGPAAFGLWQICLVALRLGGEAHLGALHAVAVETPILRGAGREDDARRLEQRALAVSLVLSGVAGVIAALLLLSEGGSAVAGAAVLLAATMIVQQAFLSDGVVLRTRLRFGRLAALQAGFAVLHLGALLLLVPTRYLTGALLAWAGAQLVALIAVRLLSADPLPRPAPTSPQNGVAVVRMGLPAWLVGASFLLLMQVDRIVVAGFMDARSLGQYGIVLLGGSLLLLVPDVVSGVLWPFAGERFGAAGRDAAALGGMVRGVTRNLAPVLAALLLFALQGTDVLVARVLPQYGPALEPLRWYLPGVYVLALALPLRHLLVTIGDERRLLTAQGVVLAGVVVLQCAVALSGGGLLGVAASSSAAALVLFVVIIRHAHVRTTSGVAWVGPACIVIALGAVAMAADHVLTSFAPAADTLSGTGMRCGVPLVLLATAGLPVVMRVLAKDTADSPG